MDYSMNQIIWFESLVSLVNINLILILFLNGKLKKKVAFILILFLFIPVILLATILSGNNPYINISFWMLCSLLCFIIPLITIEHISKKSILYIFLLYIGLSGSIVSASKWIALTVHVQEYNTNIIIASIFTNSLLFILVLLAFNKLKANKIAIYDLIPKSIKMILLFSVYLSAILVDFTSMIFFPFPREPYVIAIEILIAILIILLGVMCPILIVNSSFRTYFQSLSANMESQIDAQVKHYELLTERNRDIRNFKHDFENLKIGLKKHLADENIADALKYLDECHATDSDVVSFETGNRVADALLSEKSKIAMPFNIDIVFSGVLPPTLSSVDVCVILGNALDNAIEACSRVGDESKIIEINSNMENRILYIYIKNPVAGDVKISENHIETTKENKKQHGIGLGSIRRAVVKYDGSVEISVSEGVFMMKLVLDFNGVS
jgi:hypothetical protein